MRNVFSFEHSATLVLPMVPEAGLEPAHLAAGDFESHQQINGRRAKTPETFRVFLEKCSHEARRLRNAFQRTGDSFDALVR